METKMRTVAFLTLGCKLNYAESATLARRFTEKGCQVVPDHQPADIYVINTCSVTEHADKKCRQAIHRLRHLNANAFIAVTGCFAQLKPQTIAQMDGVQLVVGSQYKDALVDKVLEQLSQISRDETKEQCQVLTTSCEDISHIFPAYSSTTGDEHRTRSFLKVQDGCDYRCSYCTVPLARGASRNLPISTVLEQAQRIAAGGVKEIVLTGVNTGDFGKTTGESFFDLLKALSGVEGILRYRISSIEPNLLTPQIIDWLCTQPQFMPHFHIPLQSGSDKVLKLMRRRYTTALFADRIHYIKDRMPNAFIGVDVIVGFTGETEEDFQTTYDFLKLLQPAFLHVFPYSVRPNTPAAGFPVADRVSQEEKNARAARLGALSEQLHENFYKIHAGEKEEVLFEGKEKNGLIQGYTRNYIRVERPWDPNLVNQIVEVTLP